MPDISTARFIRMFGCDTARISRPCGKYFLIIGWNRNTKQDEGHWERNGEPYDFDYVQEQVIASGETPEALLRSAREYKSLIGKTWASKGVVSKMQRFLKEPTA